MTAKKRRILALIAIVCIGLAFYLRYRNEQVSLSQICPAVQDGTFTANLILEDGESYEQVLTPDGIYQDILSSAYLKHGKKFDAVPSPAFEIRVFSESGDYSMVIGADNSVAVANCDDLEGTRTFWNDPSGELFNYFYEIHLSTGGAIVPGVTSSIAFGGVDFSGVHSIVMRNMYNGKDTYLEDAESVSAICDFLSSVHAGDGGSSKGWYEGVYSLALYENASASLAILEEEEPVFHIGFGDVGIDGQVSIHYGEGPDGYPVRYIVKGMDSEEVFSFLEGYDEHPVSQS